MNYPLYILSIFFLVSCHSKIDEIEFSGNPFEEDFMGSVIEITNINSSNFSADECITFIEFKLLPDIHATLASVANETNGLEISLLIYVDNALVNIKDSQGVDAVGTGAIYDPGFSKFNQYPPTEIFQFTNLPLSKNEEHILEVIFLIRNHPNANVFNREEIVKQTILFTCDG